MGNAAAEDLKDLTPSSTREWLQHLNRRFDLLEESQSEDRELFLKIQGDQTELIKKMDSRVNTLEVCQSQQKEAVDTLKTQVKGWNILNSLGVVVAAILAALGLKGS